MIDKNFQFKIKSGRFGFTLLELLVAISIIGILIALATVSYSTAQKKSRDAKRKSDMKTLQTAFEQYYAQSSPNRYAQNSTELGTMLSGGTIPSDPRGSGSYVYTITYDTIAPVGETYCACALMEITGSGNASASNCTFGSGSYFCVQYLQ